MMKRDIDDILCDVFIVVFVLILLYFLHLCLFSLFIAEALLARALPLSISLVAIAILIFTLEYRAKK